MPTVLVVDDTEFDRRLVGGLLGRQPDWQVRFAMNGAEALERIAADPPDIVVTDIHMPVMDGLTLVARCRELHPLTPVIVMTSHGSEETAVQALKAGAASYTSKRVLARDLAPAIRTVLEAAGERKGQARLMQYLAASTLAFELENDPSLIPPLISLIQERIVARVLPDESERLRVGIALEESLTNALYHGNLELKSELRESEDEVYYTLAKQRRTEDPYRGRRIFVEARQTSQELRITIRDEGPGFDPKKLPDPTDPENLERVFGRGLLLIRTFMDEVFHNDKGNQITLVKRPGTGAPDDDEPADPE